MKNRTKYDMILDALQTLLEKKDMKTISVQEIARTAGIGKGSIYYYFSSKDNILEALIERSYKKPLELAINLTAQKDIPAFTRMAMLFQACRTSSAEFLRQGKSSTMTGAEKAFLHQTYINYLVTELKPVLTSIIKQGIQTGDIEFDHPAALAEIVLIVLTLKLDNTIVPASEEEIAQTIRGLISLLEKGTGNATGVLNFLLSDI
ncbi:MAG: TetR/AcrR family transcriptional regulator [Eubacterium sp.]|nr:TetR/AcrR family transcriptional regulator [Eubacterium sp.]